MLSWFLTNMQFRFADYSDFGCHLLREYSFLHYPAKLRIQLIEPSFRTEKFIIAPGIKDLKAASTWDANPSMPIVYYLLLVICHQGLPQALPAALNCFR